MFNFPKINVIVLKQLLKDIPEASISQFGVTCPHNVANKCMSILTKANISYTTTSDSWGYDLNITSDVI